MSTELEQKKRFEVTAGLMKNMAIILMAINHGGYCILYQGLNISSGFLYNLQWYISRPAFVIFAYQISEGMIRTHDRTSYLKRLGILALISEIPFNLCFDRALYAAGTNVFFTLFLGALAINCIDKFQGKIPLQILIVLAAMCIAILLDCDYTYMGIGVILSFYYLRNKKTAMFISVACWLFFGYISTYTNYLIYNFELYFPYILDSAIEELHGALAFPFIALYKGKKGWMLNKWFYYFFYPAHLLLIYFIVSLILN